MELRRSSVLNANVGAVSRRTCVAMGVPWELLGSTWTLSWATAWPKCSFLKTFSWIFALTSFAYENVGEKNRIYD